MNHPQYPQHPQERLFLDLEFAVELAAFENRERDERFGVFDDNDSNMTPAEVNQLYLDEARELLTKTGQNYDPEYPDHHYIHWGAFSLGSPANTH